MDVRVPLILVIRLVLPVYNTAVWCASHRGAGRNGVNDTNSVILTETGVPIIQADCDSYRDAGRDRVNDTMIVVLTETNVPCLNEHRLTVTVTFAILETRVNDSNIVALTETGVPGIIVYEG